MPEPKQGASAASPNPRAVLVAALTDAVRTATDAGDLGAARIALEALNRLLGEDPSGNATVVDLRERRGRDGNGDR